MNIAIVGSGIAGLGAARALASTHEVTVYEAATKPGGHVHTAVVDGVAVDMGFIVCNRERYPLFFRMLAELGIETRPTVATGGASTHIVYDRPMRRFLVGVTAVALLASAMTAEAQPTALDELLARTVAKEVAKIRVAHDTV